ncbi:hypothetical protein GJ744_001291 [Endocarpon pusillum]|uniref:JmjC domain-containing protein n=1 Tax=Endocarpon pusillum TaxID=364733 RepID=A0A8H7ADG6_9EURO|nr:hypothetical protein GJ744_001291 [Endocarpon pusillum]
MFDHNNGMALESIKFSATGFKKFPAKTRKTGLRTVQQRAIAFGDHQEQRLRRHGETPNQYFTVDTTVKNLGETTEAFRIQQLFVLRTDDYIKQNPTNALEKYLHLDLDKVFHYLITEAHTTAQRNAIGLQSPALETTPRLLSTRQQFAGIHSPYMYICPRRSYTGFHKEDFNLQSANLLHVGAPNIWVLIPSRQADQFEARIAELFGLKSSNIKCSQFVRHPNVIIPPTLLEVWGIAFQVVLQLPGEIMVTDHNVYHYVWHAGPNISEAINICEEGWLPPPMYRCCSNNPTCGRGPFVSHSGMRIGDLQKLNIKPMHVPHREIKMNADSHTGLKADRFERHKAKDGRGKRTASPISKEHPDCEELGLVLKSTTNEHFSQEVAPETSGARFPTADLTNLSPVVIPDSPEATPNSPVRSTNITDSSGTDTAVKTASQTVIDHLIDGFSIEEQLDALIAEGISFGPYFNLTPADAEAMFQRFRPINSDDFKDSWLNDTALKLTLEALSAHDVGVAVVDNISIGSPQWKPPWHKEPDLVLIPVCEGDHWILVRIDIAQSIIFHHGRLSDHKRAVLEIARKIDSQKLWALQEVANCMENNGSDCGPILLADAEIALGKTSLDNLPQDSSHLRLRYLAMLLTPARANICGHKNVKTLLKRKFDGVDVVGKSAFFLSKAHQTDLIAAFASPQVFADLCVLRQSAGLRPIHRTQTLVSHAMVLNTTSQADQILSTWSKEYSCIILSQRHRSYRNEVERWRVTTNRRRRREFKHSKSDRTRSPPFHLDTYAACIMLHEWDGDHAPDVHGICQQLRDNNINIGQDRQEKINVLKQQARSGHDLYDFITTFGVIDPLEMPLWMLMPCRDKEAQRYIGLSASESQDFWKKLQRDRPRLCHSFRDLYRGLRVILGLDNDCELRIDNMNPVELVKEEPDSELLLSCLLPATVK